MTTAALPQSNSAAIPRQSTATPRQDRLASGLAYICTLVPFLGMFVPLVFWVAERKRSPLVGYHAVQALLYQSLYVLGMVLYQILYLVGFLGMMALIFGLPLVALAFGGDQAPPMLAGVLLIIFFGFGILQMLMVFLVAILVPVYYIFALITGWRVLQGKDPRLPLLARLATRWGGSPNSTEGRATV